MVVITNDKGCEEMSVCVRAKKHTKTYYMNKSIDAMLLQGKDVCPWCRVEPNAILACSVREGAFLFVKKCTTCGSFVKVYRSSNDI